MSNSNFGSGTIGFRNRRLPIVWTGQFAQHVSEKYFDSQEIHPFLHVAIQQAASNIRNWIKSGKKSVYNGYGNYLGINIVVVIEIKPKFSNIKTCYKGKEPMKNTSISGVVEELGYDYPDHLYQELVDIGVYDTFEEAKRETDKHTFNQYIKPYLKKSKKKPRVSFKA
jgi:hypothetical protein